MPRSGTNYFFSKLVLLPDLLLAWEPFNRGVTKWFDQTSPFLSLPETVRGELTDVAARDADLLSFYERAFAVRHLNTLGCALSVLSCFHNTTRSYFGDCVISREVKVVVLERMNRFASYASYVNVVLDQNYTKQSTNAIVEHFFHPSSFEMYKDFVDTTFSGIKEFLRTTERPYLSFLL